MAANTDPEAGYGASEKSLEVPDRTHQPSAQANGTTDMWQYAVPAVEIPQGTVNAGAAGAT